jgi:hypothetical protein
MFWVSVVLAVASTAQQLAAIQEEQDVVRLAKALAGHMTRHRVLDVQLSSLTQTQEHIEGNMAAATTSVNHAVDALTGNMALAQQVRFCQPVFPYRRVRIQ